MAATMKFGTSSDSQSCSLKPHTGLSLGSSLVEQQWFKTGVLSIYHKV